MSRKQILLAAEEQDVEWWRQMSGTKKGAEELFGFTTWQQVVTFHKPHARRGTDPLFNN